MNIKEQERIRPCSAYIITPGTSYDTPEGTLLGRFYVVYVLGKLDGIASVLPSFSDFVEK